MKKNKNKNKSLLAVVFSLLFLNLEQASSNELHNAVENNESDKINEILNKNSVLFKDFDENGNTPIHKAILENKSSSLNAFMLHKKDINIQITNKDGETPLVYAIKKNNYNAVLFILDNGINPFYKDKNGKNSLDYVKIFGDITTKKIYNDYYYRNKEKIKILQENYQSPLDLSLFKDKEVKKVVDKKEGKTTVQDLLIANKNKKDGIDLVDKSEEESLAIKTEITQLKNKVEELRVDNKIVDNLQVKVNDLKDENEILKKKLRFKENTGIENLTPIQESIVSGPYAGIYEQQLMYEQNVEEVDMDLMDKYNFVEDINSSNENIDSIIEKSKNYEENKNNNLKSIEADLVIESDSIKDNINKNNDKNISMLPVNGIPENNVNTIPVIEDNKPEILNTMQIEKEIKNNITIKEIANIKVKEDGNSIIKVLKEVDKPEIKIEIEDDIIETLDKNKYSLLNLLFLTLCLVGGVLGVVLHKEHKKTKRTN